MLAQDVQAATQAPPPPPPPPPLLLLLLLLLWCMLQGNAKFLVYVAVFRETIHVHSTCVHYRMCSLCNVAVSMRDHSCALYLCTLWNVFSMQRCSFSFFFCSTQGNLTLISLYFTTESGILLIRESCWRYKSLSRGVCQHCSLYY